MRRTALFLAALLFAGSAPAQYARNVTAEVVNVDGSDASGTYATMTAPSGCDVGEVPYFNSSLQLVCSPTVYAPTTDTTTFTGTVAARNLTAAALATPVITPPVSPVLSLLTTVTVVAGASLADGDYFTLSDGTAVVYEFDNDATVTGGRVGITFAGTETAQEIRDLVIIAVNGSTLAGLAVAAAADTFTVTLDVAGNLGGVNSENVTDAGFLVPVWGEPTHATTYGYVWEMCTADGKCSPSAEVQTTTGHATLSGANYNSITVGAVAGSVYGKLTRVTGTPAGGDAPPRLIYTGTLLNFSDTNATSTSDAPATVNETGRVTSSALTAGRVPIVGTGGRVEDDAGLTYDAATDTLTVDYVASRIKTALASATGNVAAASVSGTLLSNYGQTVENTSTLPAAVAGYNFIAVVGTSGAGAWHIKAGAGDKLYLDGAALDDGDKASLAVPAVGNTLTCVAFQTGASAWDWLCTSGGGATWTDGGA